MKKIYTLIIASVVCTQATKAQFTMLKQYHEPSATNGVNIADMVIHDSTSAMSHSSGQSQSWDYSALSWTSSKMTATYVAPSAAPHATNFPSATIAANKGNNNYSYFLSDSVNQTFELLGTSSGSVHTTYSNNKVLLKWPIQFGSTYSDTYAATEGTTMYEGNYSVEATGAGNLMLPGGKSFSDALQVMATDHYTTMTASDTSMTMNKHYVYYVSVNRYPILSIMYSTVQSGTTTTSSSQILVNWLEAVGLTDNNFEASYAIYPNPATSHFAVRLTNDKAAVCNISIQNLTGSVVREVNLGSATNIETTVDVSDLPKGVYMVRTTLGDKTGCKKLIID